jgi:heme/copper-type cytochrome/quinol oxidase subunit 3
VTDVTKRREARLVSYTKLGMGWQWHVVQWVWVLLSGGLYLPFYLAKWSRSKVRIERYVVR